MEHLRSGGSSCDRRIIRRGYLLFLVRDVEQMGPTSWEIQNGKQYIFYPAKYFKYWLLFQVTMTFSGNYMGIVISLPVSGLLAEHFGWESIFYVQMKNVLF